MAAQSQGLYKAEDLMPSDSDLDHLTTSAAKLVILQRMKQKLDRLDKDLDQRRTEQDLPLQHC